MLILTMENNTVDLETLNGSLYDIDVNDDDVTTKATKLLMFKIGELPLINPIPERIIISLLKTLLNFH